MASRPPHTERHPSGVAPQDAERRRVRAEVRRARRRLRGPERARRSKAVCIALMRSGALLGARHVACFWPNDGEVDLRALFPSMWQRGVEVLLPVVAGARLWFAPFAPDTPLAANRFGIPEPRVPRRAARPLLALDAVLVPLVAFDSAGRRLGMGGGYYDRTFGWRRHRQALRRPRLIGIAFDFQRRETLPGAPWDVPLDAVATDAGFQHLRRTR
jgi:5-formyltetrahydrofolate cyclo-ligase